MRRLPLRFPVALLACALAACTTKETAAPPPTTGTLSGTVTDAVALDALAGVAVTAKDAGGATIATATTGADGAFSLTVPAGSLSLVFSKTRYTSPPALDVGVTIGRTVHLAVALSEAASGRPSLSLGASGDDFGYGASVPLVAAASDPNGDALAYAWSNATWPALGDVSGSGASGAITFPTMAEAFAARPDSANPGQLVSGYVLPDRFGIVPIFGDTRGSVTAQVTVSDGRGQSATATLTLSAASPATGVRSVALGARVYLDSGHAGASAWSLATSPNGSLAALDDPTSRTPSFVPDLPGTYTLTEGASSIDVFANTWFGAISGGAGGDVVPDATCVLCHSGGVAQDQFTPWRQTAHATTFARGIGGAVAGFSAACVECHSVGFDLGAASGGLDDAAAAAGWTFPAAPSASGWQDLWSSQPAVARLANVQCESCHGPQSGYGVQGGHGATDVAPGVSRPFQSPRISYAAEACAVCHGRGGYHVYSEWATPRGDGVGHSNRAGAALAAGPAGLNPSCGRCHAAQGYTLYAGLLAQGRVALNSVDAATLQSVTPGNVEPPTCVACHDPHAATNPHQLRFYGDVPLLPSGFAAYGMGAGAVCVTCHNSRNGVQTGSDTATFLHEDGEPYNAGNPTGYSAPHLAAQADLFLGRNAYFMGTSLPMPSAHAAIQDTCVGCHMTSQPQTRLVNGTPAPQKHLFRIDAADVGRLCASCHPGADGAATQAQVQAQQLLLAKALGTAVKTKLNALGTIQVRAYDAATDTYSSASASNVTIDVVANPIASVELVPDYGQNHGQLQLQLTLTNTVVIPYAVPKVTDTFGVQLGSLKNGSGVVVYALSGNFVRAAWNWYLLAHDATGGLHNPRFALAVLNATLAKDLSF